MIHGSHDDDHDDNDETTKTQNVDTTATSINSMIPPKSGAKNSDLTLEEKSAKRQLKAHLKQKTRLKKYETRWHQAKMRRDMVTLKRAEKEYTDYYQKLAQDANSVLHTVEFQQLSSAMGDSVQQTMEQDEPGRKWLIKNIWDPLRHVIFAKSDKIQETIEARDLLSNMTKGTQTQGMFENDQALLGYTRHKFMERAMLAMTSLNRYHTYLQSQQQERQQDWPRTIWSIGCGPGCDAAGVLGFYQLHSKEIHHLLLMDYVMPAWNQMVVNDLVPLANKYVPLVETSICDVCHSLTNGDENKDALSHVTKALVMDSSNHGNHGNQTISQRQDNSCLVVVSYLLTETRDRWHDFFGDVVRILPPGTLLLLSEPTAWQLHVFLEKFQDFIESHKWLDSSRDTPALQGLEGRMGPAVVMVRTKLPTTTTATMQVDMQEKSG